MHCIRFRCYVAAVLLAVVSPFRAVTFVVLHALLQLVLIILLSNSSQVLGSQGTMARAMINLHKHNEAKHCRLEQFLSARSVIVKDRSTGTDFLDTHTFSVRMQCCACCVTYGLISNKGPPSSSVPAAVCQTAVFDLLFQTSAKASHFC